LSDAAGLRDALSGKYALPFNDRLGVSCCVCLAVLNSDIKARNQEVGDEKKKQE
jgi:hypothetical protein